MNCVYILFAKKYEKEIIIRPMSFGPFSNKFTERICAKGVSLADKIYVRDRVSLKLLQKYISKQKLYESSDEAFLEKPVKVTKYAQKTLGFTVREWVEKSKREVFIDNMATLIEQTARDKGYSLILPIIQVDAPEYSEGDEIIIKDLSNLLKGRGMKVAMPLKPRNVSDALGVYGKLSYLVGMRMHSCIFAYIQGVPFTAIAYEHKHSLLEKFADDVISVTSFTS
jgi:polysaccharide pyruvyl transferase WcaK-like protein